MPAMLDNLPLYTIGRRGKPNTIVSLVSKLQDGSVGTLDDSVVLDVDFGLAKKRLMAIKESDPATTKDCVLVQVGVVPTGKIVYDPEPPEEEKPKPPMKEFTGYCGETAANPSDGQAVDAAWKDVPKYVPPKRDSLEIKEEKKLSFLEKLKKILF